MEQNSWKLRLRLTPSRIQSRLKHNEKISVSTGGRITRRKAIYSTPNNNLQQLIKSTIQSSSSTTTTTKTSSTSKVLINRKKIQNSASDDKIIKKQKIIDTTQSSSSSLLSTTTKTSKVLIKHNDNRQEFNSIKLLQTLLLDEEFKEHSKNFEIQHECLYETLRTINNPSKSKMILNYLLKKCKDLFRNDDLFAPYDNFYPLFIFDINMEPYFEFFILNQHSSLNKINRLPCTNDECLRQSRIIYALVYHHWKNIIKQQ